MWEELVESVVDLEDDLGPEGDVFGQEGPEEADGVHGVLLVDVVEALVLEFVLDVAEDLEEQFAVGGEVSGGELELAEVGQVGYLVEEYLSCGFGLLEVEVDVDQLVQADVVVVVVLTLGHVYEEVEAVFYLEAGRFGLHQ